MNIPNKYNLMSVEDYVEKYKERFPEADEIQIKEEYWHSVIDITNNVIDEIVEGVTTTDKCKDILLYREHARQEIAKLNGEVYEPKEIFSIEQRTTDTENAINIMLESENREMAASQLRRTLQMFAGTLSDEMALEIPCVYPSYKVDTTYKIDEIISYGLNGNGEPQLYRVVQDHTSQESWKPDSTPSLYSAIGLNPEGYPVWKRPTGAHDAYNTGDIVDYNGVLYKSLIDGNTWSPDEYPQGWEEYVK